MSISLGLTTCTCIFVLWYFKYLKRQGINVEVQWIWSLNTCRIDGTAMLPFQTLRENSLNHLTSVIIQRSFKSQVILSKLHDAKHHDMSK